MVSPSDDLAALIDSLESALKSTHAAEVAALVALRKLAKQTEYRPGGPEWDEELDGTGLEDVPLDPPVRTVQ